MASAQAQYAGDRACAGCHPGEARSFARTGMAQSMSVPRPDALEFRHTATVGGPPGISYASIARDNRVFHESFAAGSVLESHEVLYAIGSGRHGRSYVIARGDALFLSPLSYYSAKAAWDLSPGYATGVFHDFTRPVLAGCLFCHAGMPQPTSGTIDSQAFPRSLAIGCERCHGPGALHMKSPSVKTIVNPAKQSSGLRDDVCGQCHLGGDIRILRPGRVEWDFRPGTPLSDVMAVFSLPPTAKPDGMDAVGQASQLRMSRCWKQSQGRLSCIRCHDPHSGLGETEAAAYYRSRCLECHEAHSCTEDAVRRRATAPADNCVSCHMPGNRLNRIAHIVHTNHRIVRYKEDALDPSQADSLGQDLIYESAGAPDRRSLALAYAAAARGLPVFSGRALRLLGDVAKSDPGDAEVACALGLAVQNPAEAERLLDRAVALGSKSAEAKSALSRLLAERGETERALQLGREAVETAPYDAGVVLALARMLLRSGDVTGANALISRVRSFDPANPTLADFSRPAGVAH
jgi:hypothetical protein